MKGRIDEEFFSTYSKDANKVVGIPHLVMNAPLAVNTHKGSVGLELELEGANQFPVAGDLEKVVGPVTKARWQGVRDGSLRGSSMEYVLTQPCAPEEIPALINGLWTAFENFGTRLRNSNRCSTHVHINMNGYKINQLTSIIALWNVFEEALIEWCGELRKANHFCLSSKEASSTLQAWDNYLQTGYAPEEQGLKYSALNVLTLNTLGSFEFRCGPPADTPDIPITWATFLHHFVKYACERFPNPRELAYALSERGGEEIFRDICDHAGMKAFAAEVLLKTPNFERSCMTGFRNAQAIVMGHPWDNWMDLINKEYVPDPFAKKGKVRVERPREGVIRTRNRENRMIFGEIPPMTAAEAVLEHRPPSSQPTSPFVHGDVTRTPETHRTYQYVNLLGWVNIDEWHNDYGPIMWDLIDEIDARERQQRMNEREVQ